MWPRRARCAPLRARRRWARRSVSESRRALERRARRSRSCPRYGGACAPRMSWMTHSAVKPFAAAQHVEVLREPARAGLGPLGIVEPPSDRVPVACVERFEGRSGNGVGLELAL